MHTSGSKPQPNLSEHECFKNRTRPSDSGALPISSEKATLPTYDPRSAFEPSRSNYSVCYDNSVSPQTPSNSKNVPALGQAQSDNAKPHSTGTIPHHFRNGSVLNPSDCGQVERPGYYYPVQRNHQNENVPAKASPASAGDYSPMARWEHESMREQPWNAVGEVYMEASAVDRGFFRGNSS